MLPKLLPYDYLRNLEKNIPRKPSKFIDIKDQIWSDWEVTGDTVVHQMKCTIQAVQKCVTVVV